MSSPLLEVVGLEAGYGSAQVLFGLNFSIAPGEVVTLMGRNGMGKTTTIKSLFGMLHPTRGQITFAGARIDSLPSHAIARLGLGLVPEGRQIFPSLSVEENLIATASSRHGPARWTLPRIYDLFPPLGERKRQPGHGLSGGEQQMLAIGRALMTNPRLLVLDEATEGLAPMIRADIWSCLATLKTEGEAILVIDKQIDALAALADRHMMIEKGSIVWQGNTAALRADTQARERWLGL
jgi:branched-chain amino acid transport system ATP-binding protein